MPPDERGMMKLTVLSEKVICYRTLNRRAYQLNLLIEKTRSTVGTRGRKQFLGRELEAKKRKGGGEKRGGRKEKEDREGMKGEG